MNAVAYDIDKFNLILMLMVDDVTVADAVASNSFAQSKNFQKHYSYLFVKIWAFLAVKLGTVYVPFWQKRNKLHIFEEAYGPSLNIGRCIHKPIGITIFPVT